MDIRVSGLYGLKRDCNSQIFLLAAMGADNILEAACSTCQLAPANSALCGEQVEVPVNLEWLMDCLLASISVNVFYVCGLGFFFLLLRGGVEEWLSVS